MTRAARAGSGHYRLGDVFLPPSLVSLVRLPLAACFPFAIHLPALAFALLVVAGFSDVLDGWLARRFGQVTPTGAAIDPITDKLFVITVAATLVVSGHLALPQVLLLSMREIGELPLVLWFALSERARRTRAGQPSANVAGKAATVLQFAAVGAALLQAPYAEMAVILAAVGGAFAALSYWRRALRGRGGSPQSEE